MRQCAGPTAALLILVSTLVEVITSVHQQDIYEEVCNSATFNPQCQDRGLIYITSAIYGRMKTGDCITQDLDLGCQTDVLNQVTGECSGRYKCSFTVSPFFKGLNPCPDNPDLVKYLEVQYRCIHAYEAEQGLCQPDQPIHIHLSHQKKVVLPNAISVETTKGRENCPWKITTLPGQRITLTMIDFRLNRVSRPCVLFAKITETRNRRYGTTVTSCSADGLKEHVIYTSHGNEIQIEMNHLVKSNISFFFELKAIGCANRKGWPNEDGLWVQSDGTKAVATCNATRKNWTIICEHGHWVGKFGQCTATKVSTESKAPTKQAPVEEQFPYGILIVVAIGVALGVFLGGLLLICAAKFIRKRNTARCNHPPGELHYAQASNYIPQEDLQHQEQQYTSTTNPKCTVTSTTAHGYKTCHVRGHSCNYDKDKYQRDPQNAQQQQCYGTLPPGYHCSPTVLKSYGHFYDTDTTGIESRDPV